MLFFWNNITIRIDIPIKSIKRGYIIMFKKGLILATVLGGVVAVTTAKYLKEKLQEAESDSEEIIGYRVAVENKSENSIVYKEVESYDVHSLLNAVEEAIEEGYISDFEFITESGSYANVDSILVYQEDEKPSHLHFYKDGEDLVIEAHIRA